MRWQSKPVRTKRDHWVEISAFLHSVISGDSFRARSFNIFTAENHISVVPPISDTQTGIG